MLKSELPKKFPDRNICILGLGYVGLTLATTMADIGFRVYGVEPQDDVVEALSKGNPYFYETNMAEVLARVVSDGRLSVSTVIPDDCPASTYIITVGTPLDSEGRVRTEMIEKVTRDVASAMHPGDMVIMRSTVKIGTTRHVVLPTLKSSGKTFDLAFCPERTQEGKALEELRHLPQIVAGETHDANIRAAQMFQFLTPTVVRVSDVETAEMIKMVDNANRDVVFGFANEVARMCDAIGISAVEVIRAGKLGYPRTNLPLPGPVGGPCLSKDPYILAESLESHGIKPDIAMAARLTNERQPQEVANLIADATKKIQDWPDTPVISLLGIAFKGRPPTDDLRGTTARAVLAALHDHYPDSSFRGFDAMVSADAIAGFGLEPQRSVEDAMSGANLALILNNHPIFSSGVIEETAGSMARPGLIYDFWNHFTDAPLGVPEGISYIALGSLAKATPPQPG